MNNEHGITEIALFRMIIKDPKLIENTPEHFFTNGPLKTLYEIIKRNKSIWNNVSVEQLDAVIQEKFLNIDIDLIKNIVLPNSPMDYDENWLKEKYNEKLIVSTIEANFIEGISKFKLLLSDPNVKIDAIEKYYETFKRKINKDILPKANNWETLLAPILPDDALPLKTGFKRFDDWQTIRKKRTTCFIGKTNSGKTYSLVNLAATLSRQGYKVAYLSFEVERQDIRIRILSQLIGISQDTVKQIYDPEEIKRLWEVNCSGCVMPEVFSDSYNTYNHTNLVNEILKREEETNTKFDAILIDYMSLLESEEEQMYLKGKDISQAFARYSKSYDWAIITAAQVNRPGLAKTRLTMDDIAESAAMLHTFDFIISIIHNETLRDSNRIAWEILKARYVNGENRPGTISSFSIEWAKAGMYTETDVANNDAIIEVINEDHNEKSKTKKTNKPEVKYSNELNIKNDDLKSVTDLISKCNVK